MRLLFAFLSCLAVMAPAAPRASAQRGPAGRLFVVIVGDKRGYIDKAGNVVCTPSK